MSVGRVTLFSMASEVPSTLRGLAHHQSGVVSRSQALKAGLSEGVIKFKVSSGRWQEVHPGVYTRVTGGPVRGAQLWAAVLSAGGGKMLTHKTPAEIQRLTNKPVETIHVTIPGQ